MVLAASRIQDSRTYFELVMLNCFKSKFLRASGFVNTSSGTGLPWGYRLEHLILWQMYITLITHVYPPKVVSLVTALRTLRAYT
jgi:hypothetical protein